jgi:membrane protease YdiL (CAAX protease family)
MALLFMPEALGARDGSPVVLRAFHAAVSLSVGPAAEELFFRYMLFMRPGRKYGYAACAVASSALFAAVHMPGSWGLALRYFAAGLVLCGVCRYRRNLFAPFAAHVLANLGLLAA